MYTGCRTTRPMRCTKTDESSKSGKWESHTKKNCKLSKRGERASASALERLPDLLKIGVIVVNVLSCLHIKQKKLTHSRVLSICLSIFKYTIFIKSQYGQARFSRDNDGRLNRSLEPVPATVVDQSTVVALNDL